MDDAWETHYRMHFSNYQNSYALKHYDMHGSKIIYSWRQLLTLLYAINLLWTQSQILFVIRFLYRVSNGESIFNTSSTGNNSM